jgi:hypothetical protein
MNCVECQELISVYLDNELDDAMSLAVSAHLTLCAGCARMCEDLAVILESCHDSLPAEIVPPNSQALWCRISNTIEGEIKQQEQAKAQVPEQPKRGWNFTFSQLGSAIAGVALISSLLTVVGIRSYFAPPGEDFVTRTSASQTTFEKVLSKIGLADTPQQARERRLKDQQAAIEYWNKRVQARRAQWDPKMRDAFDRNLYEIDASVSEYTNILQKNPDDELSGEMLDAVLNDKMNLLRSFSDL